MILQKRIHAFAQLGLYFKNYVNEVKSNEISDTFTSFHEFVSYYHNFNAWFTPENIIFSLKVWADLLTKENLNTWISAYTIPEKSDKTVALIMAGNIPMVGFHDLLSVLITGNKAKVKLSSKDPEMTKRIFQILCEIEPGFSDKVVFEENIVKDFDAIIATGSNNSSRYFEYYFSKYPHIIRKNRHSIAVLDGTETEEELDLLTNDIFTYFGLGCRSVSKLYVPDNYQFDTFFKATLKWEWIYNHNKWANNYDYHKSVYLMNKIDFKDTGYFILKEDRQNFPPFSVIFFSHYSDICILAPEIYEMNDNIQCIISKSNSLKNATYFGLSQFPALHEYADNIDTIQFLCNLK